MSFEIVEQHDATVMDAMSSLIVKVIAGTQWGGTLNKARKCAATPMGSLVFPFVSSRISTSSAVTTDYAIVVSLNG